jgi:hypothetical protein
MSTRSSAHPITGVERADLLAWAGVLVGPAAWAAQLYGNWAMAEMLACSPGVERPGEILGLPVTTFAAIVNLVLFSATVLAGAASFARLRSVRRREDDTPGHRATWLPIAGVMTSILFAILIAMSFVVVVLVRGCLG